MRAYQIKQFGLEHLEAGEIPAPTPGPGEVLVRVRAVSLNYRDLMMVRGEYDPRLKMPRIPLSDGAGEVAGVGEGVTRFKTGDRVVGLFLPDWQEGAPAAEKSRNALGGSLDGMLAEYVVLPETGVIPFPNHLSYEEAATLPCAALTAWHALVEIADVHAGDNVVIQGTGGVSLFALQFAKMSGARVLGTSSSDQKLERAKQLGLDAGVNYRQTPQWSKWVKEQTDGKGADAVVEVGGAGTLGESLKAVRVGGIITQIGVLSGTEEKFQVTAILMRQVRIAGIYVGSRAMMERMNQAISLHHLKPTIDTVFPWDQVTAAYRYLESGKHFGKIVIAL